jgi:hypothetical protein
MGLIFESEKITEVMFHLENGSRMLDRKVCIHIKTWHFIQENSNLEVKEN